MNPAAAVRRPPFGFGRRCQELPRRALAVPSRLRSARRWRFARSHQATPFMVMLAGLNAWLALLTRSADIAVGTPVAHRRHLDTEGLVGTLVNTVVMRNTVQGGVSFEELLEQVRRNALEALAHQDISFDELVEARQRAPPAGPAARCRCCSTQNAPLGQVSFGGLNGAGQRRSRGHQFPLFWFGRHRDHAHDHARIFRRDVRRRHRRALARPVPPCCAGERGAGAPSECCR